MAAKTQKMRVDINITGEFPFDPGDQDPAVLAGQTQQFFKDMMETMRIAHPGGVWEMPDPVVEPI